MYQNRRRRKRPNYGTRTVEVARGPNGFGFTISGQQPCILSCIVKNSPADYAGLRAGDFLISVNDVSVSKTTHDAVVNLIGSTVGPIRMTIAENFYSDSSDEEEVNRMVTRKPKHKPKPGRTRLETRKQHNVTSKPNGHPCTFMKHPNDQNDQEASNCPSKQDFQANSSEYRQTRYSSHPDTLKQFATDGSLKGFSIEEQGGPIEYKAFVGYLGTIEIPQQLLPNTRLQTLCNCIRKLRQEKRTPTAVLITVLPTCLTLKNASNHILAIYPTNRVVYVGSSRDKESRYFGLVTSVPCEQPSKEDPDDWNDFGNKKPNADVGISNSCHIFATDPKLVEHNVHLQKAQAFNIICSVDPISGRCLEFPKDSLYIVSLIQSMYKLQGNVPPTLQENGGDQIIANSPQPSASSNSDSGIGFRDDFNAISDRIVLVEFPAKELGFIKINKNNAADRQNNSIACCNPNTLKMVLNNEIKLLNNNNNLKSCANMSIKNCFGDAKIENAKNSNEMEARLNNLLKYEKSNRFESNVSPASFTSSEDNTKMNETENDAKIDNDEKKDLNNVSERPIDVPNGLLYAKSEFKRSIDNLSMHSSKSLDLDNMMSVFKVPNTLLFEKKAKQTQRLANSCDNLDVCGEKIDDSPRRSDNVELNNLSFGQRLSHGSWNNLFSSIMSGRKSGHLVRSEPDVRIRSKGNDGFLNEIDVPTSKENNTESVAQKWATSFEKLLEDPEGVKALAEFLKKEFSSENIDFWVSVERFRHLPHGPEKKAEAQRIYQQHVCVGAPEAVNVDAQARQLAEQSLQEASSDMFDHAQKQVLNLMKFDSYPRFLKSDVYKQCLLIKTSVATSVKLKKSLSNAEDRRRKSLLPWHKKSRSKSKDRSEDGEATGARLEKKSDTYNSKSSLTSMDLSSTNNFQTYKQDEISTALCRVNLGNASTSVVQIKSSETVQDMVQRLLEKRGLNYNSYEVYTDNSVAIDLNESAMSLAGREVSIQQRVVFKLDLPNRKTVSVKSKATKMIIDVLKPILHKYDFSVDQVVVVNPKDRCSVINIRQPITNIDGTKLLVQFIDNKKPTNHFPEQNTTPLKTNKLLEITNRVFEGILNEKSEMPHIKPKSDKGSVKSDDMNSEHSSSYFGKFLLKDSAQPDWKKKSQIPRCKMLANSNSKNISNFDQNDVKNKPLIAKWKMGVNKLQVSPSSESECNELVEGLTRAQKSRLEDQRGTEINFELPDFLKDKENDRGKSPPDKTTVKYDNYENQTIRPSATYKNDDPKVGNVKFITSKFNAENNNSKSSHFFIQKPASTDAAMEKKEFKMEPPPLPPKPKIVPLKPPNWGHDSIVPANIQNSQSLFLEQSSSSFV